MKKTLIFTIGILTCLLSATAQKNVDDQIRKLIISTATINNYYVDSVDTEKLVEDAIRGMLEKLDPHSQYSTPEQTKRLNEPLQGSFDGIGVQFNILDDTLMVIQTITGGPAEKAGVMAGDRIISVADTAIAGVKMPQDSMIRLMKGPKGTKVKITVNRDGTLIPFDIIRDKIPVNCVDASFMINDTTGYIKLSKFTRTTYKEFSEASEKLLSMGMKRLLFDLRDNTGGYFDQALLLQAAQRFSNGGTAYTKLLYKF